MLYATLTHNADKPIHIRVPALEFANGSSRGLQVRGEDGKWEYPTGRAAPCCNSPVHVVAYGILWGGSRFAKYGEECNWKCSPFFTAEPEPVPLKLQTGKPDTVIPEWLFDKLLDDTLHHTFQAAAVDDPFLRGYHAGCAGASIVTLRALQRAAGVKEDAIVPLSHNALLEAYK